MFLFLSGTLPTLVHSFDFYRDKFVLWKSNETTTIYAKAAELSAVFLFERGAEELDREEKQQKSAGQNPRRRSGLESAHMLHRLHMGPLRRKRAVLQPAAVRGGGA